MLPPLSRAARDSTHRLLVAPKTHRHLRGERALMQADSAPLAEHMLTDLLWRICGQST